jgi:CRP-like cAMP-binding protein
VYYKNEFAESIYFIAQGRVNYLIGKNTVIFKTITAGAYFGEIELIEKVARKFSVKSENDSKLLIMHSQCFEYILKEYPRIGTEMIKAAERKNKKNEKAIEDIVKLNDVRMGVTENDKHRPYANKGHKRHFTSISDTWVYFI